ncbi:ankyrin repeat domain-containing protein [bacterium]|nr:ankyrin repeat domain-containing protein [bacterium]
MSHWFRCCTVLVLVTAATPEARLALARAANEDLDGGRHPLHAAVRAGDLPRIRTLLRNGADVHGLGPGRRKAIAFASLDRPDIITTLLKHGADIDAQGDEGRTLLHRAAHEGHVEATRFLIANGANPGRRQEVLFGSPLRAAARQGHGEVAALLIEPGANPLVEDPHGETCLHLAVRPLVEDPHGKTCLHLAVRAKTQDMFDMLVACGLDVNVQNAYGSTPLHYATQGDRLWAVEHLLCLGADPGIADNKGKTPVDRAVEKRAWDVAELLVAAGGPPLPAKPAAPPVKPKPPAPPEPAPKTPSDMLAAANKAYEAERFVEALALWEKIVANHTGTSAWPKALFNIGLLRKEQHRYDDAMAAFKRLTGSQVDDREPGAHIMEAYRNYRPRALWETAMCLLATGQHEEALRAFGEVRTKHPFESWCGNAHAEYAYRYDLHEGICLEYLGRHAEAVERYYRAAIVSAMSGLYYNPIAHVRLVDLYEAAGQTDDLKASLAETDRAMLKVVEEQFKQHEQELPPDIFDKVRPSRMMTRILDIRRMGREGDFVGLLKLLPDNSGGGGTEEAYARRAKWRAVEAAKALARSPEKAGPLLATEARKKGEMSDKWLLYALGVCRTPETIRGLRRLAGREGNLWASRSLVYAMSMAGPAGEQAIDELAETLEGHMMGAIRRHREGTLRDGDASDLLPPIPTGLKLPAGLAPPPLDGRTRP